MNYQITKTSTEKFIFPKVRKGNKLETIRVRIYNDTTTVSFECGDVIEFIINGIGKRRYLKTVATFNYKPTWGRPNAWSKVETTKYKSYDKFAAEFKRVTGVNYE